MTKELVEHEQSTIGELHNRDRVIITAMQNLAIIAKEVSAPSVWARARISHRRPSKTEQCIFNGLLLKITIRKGRA